MKERPSVKSIGAHNDFWVGLGLSEQGAVGRDMARLGRSG
jgi:hypothetical protein